MSALPSTSATCGQGDRLRGRTVGHDIGVLLDHQEVEARAAKHRRTRLNGQRIGAAAVADLDLAVQLVEVGVGERQVRR
jgi:hypothetical protein